mgnify:CR=1 FL=1
MALRYHERYTDAMTTKNAAWGIDGSELDYTVRPQDNFYEHVNKTWMKKNPIPKNESRWGSFTKLRFDTDKKIKNILEEIATQKTPMGSPEQLLADLTRSGMDMATRNALGISPLASYQKMITSIRTSDDVVKVSAELERIGSGTLFGTAVGQDSKNTSAYALHLSQGGLGLPDREYYLKQDPESVRVRTAYIAHMEKMWRLRGLSKTAAGSVAKTVLAIETKLAAVSMKKEDQRDPDRTYNKLSLAKLQKLGPCIDFDLYFKTIGVTDLPYYIVQHPEFISGVSTLLTKIPVEDWKWYLEWHLINDFASALSAPFVRQSFSFYGKVLSGTTTMQPLWRRVQMTVNGGLGELLGQLYVKRHFTPEAKKKMDSMVDDLFTAYEARITSLDWMSSATKKKALLKLHALNRKIGYPSKWKSYRGLRITNNDYVGNIVRIHEYEHKRDLKKLRGPVDRTEWFMYPQTVNAYFDFNLNDIAFPAAILQPPFFSPAFDDAVNYGCMGAVIGHEITHGFDDEGSKYDAAGNLKSWWTTEDRTKFDARAKKVEKQFNRYTVADGLKVNGKLTLGENIADLGGLSIAFDAYQLQLARTGRKDINGFSPEERFFLAFALFERENARPEFTKKQVLTDPHSPGEFRINGPVSNFEEFYKTYGITKTDGHYRKPSDREMVW